VGETYHVKKVSKTIEQWRWIGQMFATALFDGLPARIAMFKIARSPVYSTVSSHGLRYYLHKTTVTLKGGKPQTIYFFAKVERNEKGKPTRLPKGRVVRENPRNGFLTVTKKKRRSGLRRRTRWPHRYRLPIVGCLRVPSRPHP
jgi:hypothetical protein